MSASKSLFAMAVLSGLLAGCGASNTERNLLCGAQQGQPCTSIAAIDYGYASAPVVPQHTVPRDIYPEPRFGGKYGDQVQRTDTDYALNNVLTPGSVRP